MMNDRQRNDNIFNHEKFMKRNCDGIGIGETRREKIADEFWDIENTLDILNVPNLKERLLKHLSQKTAQAFVDRLYEIKAINAEQSQMTDCGIPYIIASNISRAPLELQAFKKNPYVIGQKYNIPFVACDKYAHKLYWDNPPDMNKDRMRFFINAMLAELEQSGHTFAYAKQLVRKMNTYQTNNCFYPTFYSAASVMLYIWDCDMFEIEQSNNVELWKIFRKETGLLEANIAYHIKRLADNTTIFQSEGFSPKGLKFDEVQLAAINSASKSGLKVITGPPGSGKTAVINGITQYFKSMKPDARIIMCAPTGRAAKHMTEITGEKASTIHRLLGISEKKSTKRKMLDCDMVICDEASMLNLDATYELLSHIPSGAVVYFVGDKDQLPAVGPGNVLHDIIDSQKVPTYQLTKVYRQDGIILENAHYINHGAVPCKSSEKYITEIIENPMHIQRKIVELFKKLYNPNEPFETQILIPSYKTACGINFVNYVIQDINEHEYIYKHTTQKLTYKTGDRVELMRNCEDVPSGSIGTVVGVMVKQVFDDNGDPVFDDNGKIQTQNYFTVKVKDREVVVETESGLTSVCAYKRYDKILMTKNAKNGLYQNGSVGIFLENHGDELLVEFDGEEVIIPDTAIEDMTLGYAISVHKSQGSEYKHVILCLPAEPANMLTRNIFYTAVTRAKQDISIFAMPGAIEKAVFTQLDIFMQTGLKSRLMSNNCLK